MRESGAGHEGGPVDQRLTGDLPVASAAAAADYVGDDDTLVVSGFGSVGDPKAVPEALAASDRDLSLTVVSGGSVGPPIEVDLAEAGGLARRLPFTNKAATRDRINAGEIAFHDPHVARMGERVRTGALVDADTAVVEAIAVGEDWLVPATSIGQTPAYVAAADRLVVELNRAHPLALQRFHDVYRPGLPPDRDPIPLSAPGERIGDPRVRFDPETLVAVVETDRRDATYEFRDPTAADEAVAATLRDFLAAEMGRNPALADRLTLQFGVGSLGNALMSAVADLDRGDRDLVYFGEVIQDGLLDLLDAGELASASATSLALSADGQDRLFADPGRYADDVTLRPASVSNRAALVDRFGVVAINSALEVDLSGNVNSTHIDGRRLVGGVGGSGDFNRNALVSITALPAAVDDRSRIVPHTPHVDHTEHDVDVIVTDHGVADLRGKGPTERAEALVENCAAPVHRESLRDYLDGARERGGHVPFDPGSAFDP
jgi:succinyl-CoA:acetate CoA-transferase